MHLVTLKMKKLNLEGKSFGRLLAVKSLGIDDNGRYFWFCKCSCGKTKAILGTSLISKNTKSCGCLAMDTARKQGAKNTIHG